MLPNQLLTTLLALVVAIPTAFANELSQLKISTFIMPERHEFRLMVKNDQSYDIYCPRLVYDISYEAHGRYEEIGTAQITIPEIYLRQHYDGKERIYIVGDKSSQKMLGFQEDAFIRSTKLDKQNSQCRIADIRDYCTHATLSEDEEKAMETILEEVGERSCSGLKRRMPRSLRLADKNLNTIRPLQFFPQIKYLDVSNNNIQDEWPFSKISSLKKLNASFNPISSAHYFWGLRHLEILDISATLIRTIDGIEEAEHLKGLFARGLKLEYPSFAIDSSITCFDYDVRSAFDYFKYEDIYFEKEMACRTHRDINMTFSLF